MCACEEGKAAIGILKCFIYGSVFMRNCCPTRLNDPHGEINISNLPVPVPFNTVVCGVIIVWTRAL